MTASYGSRVLAGLVAVARAGAGLIHPVRPVLP